MPINDEVVSQYTQLGIAGAALLVVLAFVAMLFLFLREGKINKRTTEGLRIDKLCDKIDALISSNAQYTAQLNKVLVSNDKDQKTTIDHLNQLLGLSIDIQRRVARIDDRTYACIPKSEEGEQCQQQSTNQ